MSVLLSVALVIGRAVSTGAARIRDANARRSVVRVHTFTCSGEMFGTGVVLADGTIMTNNHVVASARRVEIDVPGGAVGATGLSSSGSADLAIVTLPVRVAAGLEVMADPIVGVTGRLVGFPGGHDQQDRPAALRTFEAGNIGAEPDRVARLDARVVPGESGSPLIVGERIAALVYQSGSDTGEARAVAGTELRQALTAVRPIEFVSCQTR